MTKLIKIAISSVLLLMLNTVSAQDNLSVTVKVEGISSNDGKIFFALYNSETTFLNKMFKGTKTEIDNNACEIVFKNVSKGTYAVSIFHDENNNSKMDKNMFGIPKEDYGCSNNATGFMGPPKWEDAKFQLNTSKSILITL